MRITDLEGSNDQRSLKQTVFALRSLPRKRSTKHYILRPVYSIVPIVPRGATRILLREPHCLHQKTVEGMTHKEQMADIFDVRS